MATEIMATERKLTQLNKQRAKTVGIGLQHQIAGLEEQLVFIANQIIELKEVLQAFLIATGVSDKTVSKRELCMILDRAPATIDQYLPQGRKPVLQRGVHFDISDTGRYSFKLQATRKVLAPYLGLDIGSSQAELIEILEKYVGEDTAQQQNVVQDPAQELEAA